jgi:hypothetical protein
MNYRKRFDMKKWVLKAIVQKGISFLPFSHRINYFLQRHVSRGLRLTDVYFRDRIRMARLHLETCGELPAATLEIGTGWHPIVPVAFYLAGVETIHTADHYRHLSRKTLRETLDYFVGPGREILAAEGFPIRQTRMKKLEELKANRHLSAEELLDSLCIRTHLLKNGQAAAIPAGTIHLIHSNNTLAHIYDDKLVPLLKEMRRVSGRDGVLSHFVDLCDHFAHIDPSISVFHFLRYSDKQWRLRDNSLQAQSRNRLPDYLRLFEAAGLAVSETNCQRSPGEALEQVALHERFREYSVDDLLVTHAQFISRPGGRPV